MRFLILGLCAMVLLAAPSVTGVRGSKGMGLF